MKKKSTYYISFNTQYIYSVPNLYSNLKSHPKSYRILPYSMYIQYRYLVYLNKSGLVSGRYQMKIIFIFWDGAANL